MSCIYFLFLLVSCVHYDVASDTTNYSLYILKLKGFVSNIILQKLEYIRE